MKPTNKLRFIERQIEVHGDLKLVRILQQWWETNFFDMITGQTAGEWRDVPLETE